MNKTTAALAAALGRLAARDRLRLSLYYVQQLTLAQAGRVLAEHEATVSRQLARTRAALRKDVVEQLQRRHGLTEAEIARCFESAAEDSGTLDIAVLLGTDDPCKAAEPNRSTYGSL